MPHYMSTNNLINEIRKDSISKNITFIGEKMIVFSFLNHLVTNKIYCLAGENTRDLDQSYFNAMFRTTLRGKKPSYIINVLEQILHTQGNFKGCYIFETNKNELYKYIDKKSDVIDWTNGTDKKYFTNLILRHSISNFVRLAIIKIHKDKQAFADDRIKFEENDFEELTKMSLKDINKLFADKNLSNTKEYQIIQNLSNNWK